MTGETEILSAELAARLVDEAAAAADDWHDVGSALRQSLSAWREAEEASQQPGAATWTVWAFEYHSQGSPAQPDYFKPMMIFADGTGNMPFMRDLPAACLGWWALLADQVNEARPRARLEHLLFLRRQGNGGARARRAAEAYLELATGSPDIYTIDAIKVCLDLARRVRQADLVQAAIDLTCTHAASALSEDKPLPGVAIRLLALLNGESSAPCDVDDLLQQARDKFARDVHNEDGVIRLQLERTKGRSERRAQLWSERVDAWITAAEAAEPIVGVMHFQKAVEHARSSGDRVLLERATAKMQAVRRDEMQMQSFSVEMGLPVGEIERWLQPITDASTWQIALVEFARFGPITGDVDNNRQLRDRTETDFPLSQLLPPVQLGGDGLPRYQPTSEEDRRDYQLVKIEVRQLQLYSTVVLEALVRVAHNALPSLDELEEHFRSNSTVPRDLASAIGRAFLRFWAGDAEGAAFTIVPRIEALARNLLLSGDAGIYQTQRQESPGQYPPLRFLLNELLKRGLDPSWHRYLHVLSTHAAGYNYRNELSHGFLDNVGDAMAALLLQAATYLAMLRFTADETSGDTQAES
jgi:hypothetical protein